MREEFEEEGKLDEEENVERVSLVDHELSWIVERIGWIARRRKRVGVWRVP